MTLMIACATVFFAHAQDTKEVKKATVFLWSKTDLTGIGCDAKQIEEITKIKKDAAVKRKELDSKTDLAEADKKKEVKKILSERTKAMRDILTDEQKTKVDEINKKLKEEAKAAKEAAEKTEQ